MKDNCIGDQDLLAHGCVQRSSRSPDLTLAGFGFDCNLRSCPIEHVSIRSRTFCKPEMKGHEKTRKIIPKQNLALKDEKHVVKDKT